MLKRIPFRYLRAVGAVLTLLLSAVWGVGAAWAAPVLQTEPVNPLADIIAFLFGLGQALAPYAGFAAFALFAVDLLKRAGWLKDGQAGNAQALINLAGGVGLYLLKRFAPEADVAAIDGLFGEITLVGNAVVALVLQIGGTRLFYLITKWAGATKSFTPQQLPVGDHAFARQ